MRRERIERGIYRQANGTYGVYVMVGGKPCFKTVGDKLSEARRQRELRSAKAQLGELAQPSRMTFAELAESWLEGFEAQVLAGERGERTLEHYRYHLDRNLLPAFGTRRLQEISTDDCARLIAQLRGRGLSGKTIAGALVPLGRIFALALRRGYINDIPLRRLEASERPRPQKREQRVLNHEQISKLLAASLPSYRPLLATALYSGMRLSELLGLVWGEVDLGEGLIHVRHQLSRARKDKPARRVRLKTSAGVRDIPLLPQLGALLKQHKLARHTQLIGTTSSAPDSARRLVGETSSDAVLGERPTTRGLTRRSCHGCAYTTCDTPSRAT